MNPVSICLPYYLNAGMLAQQYDVISKYPKGVRKSIELIIVDDGSPRDPAVDVPRPKDLPPLRIFRMLEDIRWNQDACRNLAVAQAALPWVLLTDIDHLIPEATIQRAVFGFLDPYLIYKFGRVSAPGLEPYKPHPNSWLMTKRMYSQIGGYDERFAGYYGTDAMFRDAAQRIAPIKMSKSVLIRVPREVIPDASTTTYGRKEPQDGENIRRIKGEISGLPPKQRRPVTGRFAWEQVL